MPSAMSDTIDPQHCTTMIEVRAGVDAVDRAVVELLKRRFGYMEAAARIKPGREAVRDEWRKADVLSKVRSAAKELHLPKPELIEHLYEQLIEASIAYEFEVFDRSRG
jgi:isochorismate pyruvate lyase